uniref:Alpha-defensin N-terminal domain-containing protein n=1 Tax=Macaca fascicularis TaxID=9541 RepID=A0A7N9CUN5_MACFA
CLLPESLRVESPFSSKETARSWSSSPGCSWAESLQERADEVATQEQPGEDDQDLAVSFEENGLSTLRALGRRHQSCRSAKSRTKRLETGCGVKCGK